MDAGTLIYNYMPSDLPTPTLLGDRSGNDPLVTAAAKTEVMLLDCPQCQDEMQQHNITVLLNTATPTCALLYNKAVVVAPEDLKGLKVRATGGMALLVGNLGAVPVNTPLTDVYEGLQRGQLDCTLLSMDNLEGAGLWDVVKNVTELPMGTFTVGFLAVNADVWGSLSDAEMAAFYESGVQAICGYEEASVLRVAAARDAGPGRGTTMNSPTPELVDAVQSAQSVEDDRLLGVASGRGVKDPETVRDAVAKATTKWEAIVVDIGGQPWSEAQWDAYQAALRDEIFTNLA
ncbi:hypothetical protein [Tropicimonas isoalkanivorans]|uniref:Extracellular solute-binding protein, family 7 n=1 Tax=Tropicimonas isoalkanivorans TaxID=441112 RepID=A0A1I1I4P6_9RHOB|nr:hypothetical protein [Tropicimonas isoalkanivorans]SFC28663.1 extracellular solute-binding protein, family 7 [Tropicimonas isoalkanivorans]